MIKAYNEELEASDEFAPVRALALACPLYNPEEPPAEGTEKGTDFVATRVCNAVIIAIEELMETCLSYERLYV